MRCSGLILLVIFLGACASQTPTHYYTLSADAVTATRATLPKGAALGVGPIFLPSMLDQKSIVTRRAGGPQIDIANYEVWAGDLKQIFGRVTAELIGQSLGSADVWASPWDTRQRPEFQLRLFVDKFFGELGGPVTLKLKWTLLADQGQRSLGTWTFDKTQDSDGSSYSSYVQTLNQLLADFAAEAATAIASLINEPGVYPVEGQESGG